MHTLNILAIIGLGTVLGGIGDFFIGFLNQLRGIENSSGSHEDALVKFGRRFAKYSWPSSSVASTSTGSPLKGSNAVVLNPVIFVVLYFAFMTATYILPYGGSNSVILQTTASDMHAPQAAHFQLLFWLHLGSLVILCLLTWLRGNNVGKNWIVIFPIIAGLFDLAPGLSIIPLVPTVMHICALIMGARGHGIRATA